jgi:hypothetical protein
MAASSNLGNDQNEMKDHNFDDQVIYTIGHSTHQAELFLNLLLNHGINCIVDVRSVAASKYNPQFNKENIAHLLKSHNIKYIHLPEEFGARRTNVELLGANGKVDFEKVRKDWSFKEGLERLNNGIIKGFRIALMCSEADPLGCHRFSMISVALQRDGFIVEHILKDSSVISNKKLEELLVKKFNKKLPQPDIFNPNISAEDQLKAAYRLVNEEIGFSPNGIEEEENYD